MKNTENPDKKYQKDSMEKLIKIITEQLYPEERFPITIFPDLVPLLSGLYLKITKQKEEKQDKNDNRQYFKVKEEDVKKALNLNSLIKFHPNVLVLLYRNLIVRYISQKHFNKNEVEDIVHDIITIVLKNKIEKFKSVFSFSEKQNPTFTSYFMVTIRNIYIDMLRKEKKEEKKVAKEVNILNIAGRQREEGFTNLIIDEELQKLRMLLSLYRKNQAKIILTLKMKYNQKPSKDEILACFENCSKSDIDILSSDFSTLYERKIFEIITPVYSRYSSPKLRPDSLRKWISDKIGEIKDHMNKTHPNNPYNSKNIPDLFLIFFNRNKQTGRMKNAS